MTENTSTATTKEQVEGSKVTKQDSKAPEHHEHVLDTTTEGFVPKRVVCFPVDGVT